MAKTGGAVIDPWTGFIPRPTQERFLSWHGRPQEADFRLLSSGYGEGKTAAGCRESIRYALERNYSRHAVTRFHYPDLVDTTLVTYQEQLAQIGLSDGSRPGPRHYTYVQKPPTFHWANGSVTMFRNLDDPTGSKYGSMEVNTWMIDEGFEVPEEVIKVIYPHRLRWHLPSCSMKREVNRLLVEHREDEIAAVRCSCPKRLWVCTNPGPNDLLKRIVRGTMDNAAHFAIPAGENVYHALQLDQRIRQAEAYGPMHKARFIDGSWDAFEGQRFPMLSRSEHILAEDINPTLEEFDIFEGHDFGYRNPHATIWIAVHKERELPPIVIDDYEEAELEIPEHADNIRAMRRQRGWSAAHALIAVGDPAGNQTRGHTGLSDVMLFAKHGLEIIPMGRAKIPEARADLIALMLSRRVNTRQGPMRGLMFNPRAARAFERVLEYRYRDKPRSSQEDAPEKFLKKEDHLVDALGYGVSAIPDPLERDTAPEPDWAEAVAWRRLPTVAELDAQAWTMPA